MMKTSSPAPLEPDEIEAFGLMFGAPAPPLVVGPDRYIISHKNPLRLQHVRISELLGEVTNEGEGHSVPVAASKLAALKAVRPMLALAPEEAGALVVALIERTLWMELNGDHLGQLRPEYIKFSLVLPALVRLRLERGCIFPQRDLARVLAQASAHDNYLVLSELPQLATILEQEPSLPLADDLKGSLTKFAALIDGLAADQYRYDGGRNAVVGGERIGKLAARLRALATRSPSARGTPVANRVARPAKALIDLANVRACVPISLEPRPKVASKRIELRRLSKHADLAQAIFGAAVGERLDLSEMSFEGVVLLESESMGWAAASGYVSRNKVTAKKLGVTLALATRSMSDAAPTPANVREALGAVSDDSAYRAWLSERIANWGDLYRETQPAFEEAANEAAAAKAEPKVARARKAGEEAVLVAIKGPSAILPALFGFGDFNECPDPVVHAAVLGRWEREYGARVRHVGDDSLAVDIDKVPRKAASIAWAAVAHHAYCPEYSGPAEGVGRVLASTWSFWWD